MLIYRQRRQNNDFVNVYWGKKEGKVLFHSHRFSGDNAKGKRWESHLIAT